MRINIENDRFIDYTTFSSGNFVCQCNNIAFDLIWEVVELFAWYLLKYTPWLGALLLNMIQTEFKWSSSDDTLFKITKYALYLTSPLGKKSRPTMFSRTEDLPAD